MIVNNWYVFFDFQNWRDCSSEHDWDGGKVLCQHILFGLFTDVS